MEIRTVRVPTDLRRVTRLGLQFYHDLFFDAKAQRRVEEVRILFRDFGDKDTIAYCDFEQDGNRLPTHFSIEINNAFRDIKVSHYAKTLFHELTHVRQYATGQLRYRRARDVEYHVWKGTRYDTDHDYFESPWEQEAFGVEACAWNRFYQVHPEFKIHAKLPRYLGRSAQA